MLLNSGHLFNAIKSRYLTDICDTFGYRLRIRQALALNGSLRSCTRARFHPSDIYFETGIIRDLSVRFAYKGTLK